MRSPLILLLLLLVSSSSSHSPSVRFLPLFSTFITLNFFFCRRLRNDDDYCYSINEYVFLLRLRFSYFNLLFIRNDVFIKRNYDVRKMILTLCFSVSNSVQMILMMIAPVNRWRKFLLFGLHSDNRMMIIMTAGMAMIVMDILGFQLSWEKETNKIMCEPQTTTLSSFCWLQSIFGVCIWYTESWEKLWEWEEKRERVNEWKQNRMMMMIPRVMLVQMCMSWEERESRTRKGEREEE